MMRYIISSTLASASLFTGSFALAAPPQIVTDIPPVHALVSLVTGELSTPVLLLEPGASEHHFQLRPSQAREIAAADLVVQISPELTPWLDKALGLRPAEAATLTLLSADPTLRRAYNTFRDSAAAHEAEAEGEDHAAHAHEEKHGDAHGHGHDHKDKDDHGHKDHGHDEAGHKDEHDHGHDDHGHDHSGTDPHAWLDPENGRIWLALIAEELARLDPENAATYRDNAARAEVAITAAETEAKALLAPVSSRPFATFHDAWGYYTAHFGLNAVSSIAGGDAATPGAKHLTALRARVEAGEIRCIFPEAGYDPAAVTRLAESTGLRIGGALDPIGTKMTPGADLYAELLLSSARTISDCLKD